MVLTLPTIWFFTSIALKNKVSSTNSTNTSTCCSMGEKPSRRSITLNNGVTGSSKPMVILPEMNAGIHKAIASKAITTY